ncbi:16475_t:CDS:2, partial [Racocetra fulgida]
MSEQPSKLNASATYYTGATKETGQAAQVEGNAEYDAAIKEAPPSKFNANYNATVGAVKETIGSAIGHTSLEKSGAEQRRKGNEELEAAKMTDYVSGAGNKVKGAVQEQVGATIGDKRMEAEGAATKIKG